MAKAKKSKPKKAARKKAAKKDGGRKETGVVMTTRRRCPRGFHLEIDPVTGIGRCVPNVPG